MNDTYLTNEQIDDLRKKISVFSSKLLEVPYEYGAEWLDNKVQPKSLDCSELVEGVYNHFGLRMPDGSQNQFYFTKSCSDPRDGDLAFFGRGAKETQIYHVGLVYGENILEARGYQPGSSFKTGEVILRPRDKWEQYRNWVGYRSHPKLIYHKRSSDMVIAPRQNNVA